MRRTILVAAILCAMTVANIASADIFGTGNNQFTIDFVNISGNANPTVQQANEDRLDGYGIVNNDYRMGTYEITNGQWNMFTNINGIPTGDPSDAYDVSAYWTGTNVPVNRVSWYECAQFVNWLNTSTDHQAAYKFTGTQGMDDYTLGVWESGDAGYDSTNTYRNSNAYYFLPTEDEWVKAAYWNGTSLQTYANASPDDLVSGSPDPAKWNYVPSALDEPWNIGSGSEELNGTFDMMGNVKERMENPFSGDYLPGSNRSNRGGSYQQYSSFLSSSDRLHSNATDGYVNVGFRVASVPEPATLLLLGLGGLVMRRRRRRC